MEWNQFASVDLPLGTQIGDLLGVVDQLEAQVKAVLSSKRSDAVPHVKELDPVVCEAHDDLLAARDALRSAEAKRPATAVAPDRTEAASSNERADDSWRSLENLLDAGRTLTDDVRPGRVEAEMLYRRLFDDDGIRFINYRARRQWDAAQKLVAVLDEPDVIATVEALGGKRHLKALRKAHHEFGAGHGFSQAKELAPEVTTSTRAEQLALQAALRDYLVKVSTRVSRRKPESAALARFLLAPYAELVDDLERSSRRTTKKAAAPADPAAPTA